MRSNRLGALGAAALALVGAYGIAAQRAPLAKDFTRIRQRSDTYVLPSVEQTYVASLGYRSALADLIFGHVLVSYGLHFQEKRLFEHIGDYLDVINELDPKFRDPYRYADTLLTLQPEAPPPAFYRKARQVLERGVKNLPNDQELWLTAGQFLAYLAPAQLSDPQEKQEYKRTGARYLMRACELIGSNDNIPHHCITAANLLNADGNRAAAEQFLRRFLAVTDDPELQKVALGYMKRVMGDSARAVVLARQARFTNAWQADLSLSPRQEVAAIGPRFITAACAGIQAAGSLDCVTSWREWAALDPSGTP